jgi:hypothetical protein
VADSQFLLTNDQGEQVPCQTSILAQWNDGSARWILLDFQAAPPPSGTARFALSWGDQLELLAPRQPVCSPERPKEILQSGSIQLSPATNGLLDIGDRLSIRMTLIDDQGQHCVGIAQSSELEMVGPLRGTMFLRGAFLRPDGSRVLGFQLRASLFAGSSAVRLEPHLLVDPDAGVVQQIRGLSLEIVPRSLVRSISLSGRSLKPAGRLVRLLQVDDENWRFEGVQGTGSKAPGWAELTDAQGTVAVAVRDFWQQWPKSLEADDRRLILGLLPEFSAGTFDHMGPWYKHQYLFNGDCYRLRTGQSRRWQIWLDLSGNGDTLVQCANSPLVPAADPNQAIATGVWGPIEPAGASQTKAYDQWAENLFVNGYLNSIAVQRDYGALNWGDWWGERGCNWGNHEYDTPRHVLLQFVRTGDPNYRRGAPPTHANN